MSTKLSLEDVAKIPYETRDAILNQIVKKQGFEDIMPQENTEPHILMRKAATIFHLNLEVIQQQRPLLFCQLFKYLLIYLADVNCTSFKFPYDRPLNEYEVSLATFFGVRVTSERFALDPLKENETIFDTRDYFYLNEVVVHLFARQKFFRGDRIVLDVILDIASRDFVDFKFYEFVGSAFFRKFQWYNKDEAFKRYAETLIKSVKCGVETKYDLKFRALFSMCSIDQKRLAGMMALKCRPVPSLVLSVIEDTTLHPTDKFYGINLVFEVIDTYLKYLPKITFDESLLDFLSGILKNKDNKYGAVHFFKAVQMCKRLHERNEPGTMSIFGLAFIHLYSPTSLATQEYQAIINYKDKLVEREKKIREQQQRVIEYNNMPSTALKDIIVKADDYDADRGATMKLLRKILKHSIYVYNSAIHTEKNKFPYEIFFDALVKFHENDLEQLLGVVNKWRTAFGKPKLPREYYVYSLMAIMRNKEAEALTKYHCLFYLVREGEVKASSELQRIFWSILETVLERRYIKKLTIPYHISPMIILSTDARSFRVRGIQDEKLCMPENVPPYTRQKLFAYLQTGLLTSCEVIPALGGIIGLHSDNEIEVVKKCLFRDLQLYSKDDDVDYKVQAENYLIKLGVDMEKSILIPQFEGVYEYYTKYTRIQIKFLENRTVYRRDENAKGIVTQSGRWRIEGDVLAWTFSQPVILQNEHLLHLLYDTKIMKEWATFEYTTATESVNIWKM